MHDLRASINLQRLIIPIALSDTIAVVDLRQLSALVAVDDHGSFSAPPRALYTAQSNLSAHIAHLQRALEHTIDNRAKGRQRVTLVMRMAESSESWVFWRW